jgi:hypothetical protein
MRPVVTSGILKWATTGTLAIAPDNSSSSRKAIDTQQWKLARGYYPMDCHFFSGNGFKYKFFAYFVEDSGDAGAGIQRERKRPLTVYLRFNDDAPVFFDVVGGDRERTILVQHTGATPQHKDSC